MMEVSNKAAAKHLWELVYSMDWLKINCSLCLQWENKSQKRKAKNQKELVEAILKSKDQ